MNTHENHQESAGDQAPPVVLVTGASGFIGRAIVSQLADNNYQVRAFVRAGSESRVPLHDAVETFVGDVTDRDSLRAAVRGASHVVHAAADTSGTKAGGNDITVGGTRNVLEVCTPEIPGKLVYISSCSVYEVASASPMQSIDERSQLESRPAERGAYSWAKHAAESVVRDHMQAGAGKIVILRPGVVYGRSTNLFPPIIGYSVNNRFFVVIGNGSMPLPLVHVESVAEAITACLDSEDANGGTFNLVDPEIVTKRTYIDGLIRPLHPGARFLYIPFRLIKLIVKVQERLLALLGRSPVLSFYRLISSQNPVIIDGSAIRKELDWTPTHNFRTGAREVIAGEHGRSAEN